MTRYGTGDVGEGRRDGIPLPAASREVCRVGMVGTRGCWMSGLIRRRGVGSSSGSLVTPKMEGAARSTCEGVAGRAMGVLHGTTGAKERVGLETWSGKRGGGPAPPPPSGGMHGPTRAAHQEAEEEEEEEEEEEVGRRSAGAGGLGLPTACRMVEVS